MIIVDPVALGDAACTRPSPKWVYNRTGTLVEVPANTLGVTYDPADLSKAPYALIEPEATNYIRNNTMHGAVVGTPGTKPTFWGYMEGEGGPVLGINSSIVNKGVERGVEYIDVRYQGVATATGTMWIRFEFNNSVPAAVGQKWVHSSFHRLVSSIGAAPSISVHLSERNSAGNNLFASDSPALDLTDVLREYSWEYTLGSDLVAYVYSGMSFRFISGQAYDFTIRIGLPRLERDRVTSPIKTSGTAITRAADVIGSTAGLIYSNVPMVEPPYDAAVTYAKDAAVYDPATKIVYWSMQAANVGKPLSDPSWWNKRTAINRWAMFDDRNSTVTSNPEEIIVVISAKAITQGFFAGALDASEVRISMTHPTRGVVYSEKRSLVLPRSGSSFYGWCFNRLRMRTWFRTLKLPVFANALVTITILKPGGVPKCGMALLGPVEDGGSTLMGLSTELKDYSTTTFFADGSSDTVVRGFSKRMSVDVSVERDRVESLEDYFVKRRQKTLVIFGSTLRGDGMLVGKVSSFRKVIDSYPRSKMALQIEGVLSQ